jgi:hypothetical protein
VETGLRYIIVERGKIGMGRAVASFLALLLLFGCASSPTAQGENRTFTCPDGSNVTNSSLCKKAEATKYICPDGTAALDSGLCPEKEPETPTLSPEEQRRVQQIARVKNASAAIDLDRQLLLRGKFLYNTEPVEGCRDYFGYYQGIARKFQSDYGVYLDEFGRLAGMYAENGTCSSSVSNGKQSVGAAWDYGWNNAGRMMALCTEDEPRREWLFRLQAGTTWNNTSAAVSSAMDGLDSNLSRDCTRAYKAQKETVN